MSFSGWNLCETLLHQTPERSIKHSEKFPIPAVHRFAPSDTAADWLPAMRFGELFAQARESDISCDRTGAAPVQNIWGSHVRAIIVCQNTSMHILASRWAYALHMCNLYINGFVCIYRIQWDHVALSHVRNRNPKKFQSQNFDLVSAMVCLPKRWWKKFRKIWRKHRISWILVSIQRDFPEPLNCTQWVGVRISACAAISFIKIAHYRSENDVS